MTLVWLILLPLIGGAAAGAAGRWVGGAAARWVSVAALAGALALALSIWPTEGPDVRTALSAPGPWLAEFDAAWVPSLGIGLHLAADGLGLLMLLLTFALGLVAVAASWREIGQRTGLFHLLMLWSVAGMAGVFVALDLLLFFLFWEAMLVPMYLLIGLWGHEGRVRAALKFVLFTQAGGLLMLVSILALTLAQRDASGVLSFDYLALLGTELPPATAMWLMLGFVAAFAVKLPAVPVHTWLPDAHTEAPTGGSVLLAGVLLKTGAYGLLRFAVPLFPEAAAAFAPVAMALGAAGILYGAVLAFAQADMKRLIAYTSISHMGFVLIGVFAWVPLAVKGAVMQMLAHGAATAALFVLAGMLQERLHTRETARMGGLWALAPRLSAAVLFFAVASLGLPGLGNFVGEFLVLLGAWPSFPVAVAVAAVGLVLATVYALALVSRTVHGPPPGAPALADATPREIAVLAALGALVLWLGVYPQPVLDVAAPALEGLRAAAAAPPVDAVQTGR